MSYSLENWMKNVPDEKNIFELNIPGTHDCVTQFVQLSHFAKCQNKSIYSQLCCGVRALDIRVESRKRRLKMVHGITKAFNKPSHFSKQMDFGDVILHIKKFLAENPSEAVIIQFKNDSRREEERCFDILYNEYIKKEPGLFFTQNRVPRMGEVRSKIYLIRRCRADFSKGEYNENESGLDFSRWVEQDTISPDSKTLCTQNAAGDAFVIYDRFKYKPKPRWENLILPTLESARPFCGEYIINYLSTSGGVAGPERNAQYINPKFLNYPLKKENYYGTIYADFADCELCRKIIDLNF